MTKLSHLSHFARQFDVDLLSSGFSRLTTGLSAGTGRISGWYGSRLDSRFELAPDPLAIPGRVLISPLSTMGKLVDSVARFLVLSVVTAGGLTAAPTAAKPAVARRPAYQLLRCDENWDFLRDEPKTDFFDPVKCIGIDPHKTVWLSLGGQLRERLEAWRNFSFGGPAVNDDSFALQRVQMHGDLHLGQHVRVFAEGIDARVIGNRALPGGYRPADVNSLDLLNAFVDFAGQVGGGHATLRVGRQQLAFGKQRLVSPLPWLNTYRHWDGFTCIYETPQVKLSSFYTWFVPVLKYEFDRRDPQERFYGAYATVARQYDFYVLIRDRKARGDRRETFGFHTGDKRPSGWDYDVEAALQTGSVRGAAVRAYMLGSEAGYTFQGVRWSPRLAAGFDYGSGDGNPADRTVRTFDQLYPLGHLYLGYIDIVGRQNIADTNASLEFKPHPKIRVQLAEHFFRRANARDALYDAGGAVVRAGNLGASRAIGTETDLTAWFALNPHWGFEVGVNRFFAGAFIRQSGRSDDITFAYTQLTFRF